LHDPVLSLFRVHVRYKKGDDNAGVEIDAQ
jgi:hypothetical protein